MRVFVRIRISGISGIIRISIRPACGFRYNRTPAKTNTDERLPIKDEPVES